MNVLLLCMGPNLDGDALVPADGAKELRAMGVGEPIVKENSFTSGLCIGLLYVFVTSFIT